MAGSRIVWSLPWAPGTAASFPAGRAARVGRAPLWLAIVLPRLALEVLDYGGEDRPSAVVERRHGRRVIHTASPAAAAAGIAAAMPVNAAYALCPALAVHEYDPAAQQARLLRLARWAQRYSAQVSLEPPRALLLEIGGSLRLFGGLEELRDRIVAELAVRRHAFAMAIAPTPLAGLWLAAGNRGTVVIEEGALRSVLGPLPIESLPIDEQCRRQLAHLGVRVLRDLWRLPVEGLARRFGSEFVHDLDRALGRRPDPRDCLGQAERFAASFDFPLEIDDHGLILTAVHELCVELADYLRARDACITDCRLELHHGRPPPTRVVLGVRKATRDAGRLAALLAERCQRLTLRAPVTGVALIAGRCRSCTAATLPLRAVPPAAGEGGEGVTRLLEQLQARLGRRAVRGIQALAEHRPEGASRLNDIVAVQAPPVVQQRPLWLLPVPQPLGESNGGPWCRGAVALGGGPERIESGWWSGDEVRRDYYPAVDGAGRRLWVYRDLRDGGWYLHGLFG